MMKKGDTVSVSWKSGAVHVVQEIARKVSRERAVKSGEDCTSQGRCSDAETSLVLASRTYRAENKQMSFLIRNSSPRVSGPKTMEIGQIDKKL